MSTKTATNVKGRVSQVIGAVVDVALRYGVLPAILNALETTNGGEAAWSWKSPSILAKARCAPSPWTRPKASTRGQEGR